MTPRRLSQFEIFEELGAGGMGVVYRAFDTRLQRPVAIKTLSSKDADPAQRARFLAEARAASALSHPGIVTIYEVGTADDVDYIAMELVAGRTLAELLVSGPFSEQRVLDHARQLAAALAAAHRAGIVHRDLKPANVVVTADDRLKILDFGLAKRFAPTDPARLAQLATIADSERTADGTVLGTPAYMAPEQARGLPVDARTDLFALGGILYEELTGSRPFTGSDSLELLSALLRDTPVSPSQRRRGLSRRWDGLVGRLLAREPAARWPSAEAFAGELDSCFGGVGAPRASRRWWGYAVALAALVAVAAAVVLVRSSGRERTARGDSEAPAFQFRLFSDFPGSHREPTLAPDGSAVAFVADDAAGVAQVWVRSWAGGDPIQITHGEPAASAPRWAKSGDRIVFARQGGGIWAVPPLGGQAHRLVESGQFPELSPAGDRLVFVARGSLWLARGDGADPRPLESLPPTLFGNEGRASFSPDGRQLVAFWPLPDRPNGDLWRVEVASLAARRLTDLEFWPGSSPTWSGDGRSIVFASDHSGSTTLWSVAAEGGEPTALTSGAGEDTDPVLSADGRRLLYTNTRNSWRLKRFDPETRAASVLFEQRRPILLPRLSPDGRRVAFFARAFRALHLYVLELATGSIAQLTRGERVLNILPCWTADGKSLIYFRGTPEAALRIVGADGLGDRILVDGWHWTTQYDVSPSPDGRSLVYLKRQDLRGVETRLYELASGRSRALAATLSGTTWSADGSSVLGTSRPKQSIVRCPVDGGACRALGRGSYARLAADGRTLFSLRQPGPRIVRRDLPSGREEELGSVAEFDFATFDWGLAPDGTLIYPEKFRGRQELWLGERIGESERPASAARPAGGPAP